MNLTAQQILAEASPDATYQFKFVRTNRGYRFCSSDGVHKECVPEGETPVSAGFAYVIYGSEIKIDGTERSGTLRIGPRPEDREGLEAVFGLPAIYSDR